MARSLSVALFLLGWAFSVTSHAIPPSAPHHPSVGSDESNHNPLGGSPEAPPDSRYRIEARLDAQAHVVDGVAQIHWTNTSRQAADDLVFHLYLNAFAHSDTVFFRERGASARGTRLHDPGFIEVEAIRVTKGGHRMGAPKPMGPDGDRTQLRVPIEPAVAPGETVDLEVRFQSKLPSLVARSGYAGDFHMVAQWFPKLARREPDGHWASFPYHGKGEFYADFARYELSLDVPATYVVAATGRRVASRRQGGRKRYTYVADRVHDAAWAASPHLRVHRFDTSDVAIRVYAPPGYGFAAQRQGRAARAGLQYFGALFGAYPYPTLDVVIPPPHAEGASGMEYPTLIVTAGSWLTWPVPGSPDPVHDGIVAHELAHQWFQGMLASHELEAPWLDEGLAQWATYELLRHRFGADGSGWNALGISVDALAWLRWGFLSGGEVPSSLLPAHRYASWSDLARAVYTRPALLLESLACSLGRDRLQRALGRYARTQRFRHPSADDLFAQLDAEYGEGFARRVMVPLLRGRPRLDVQLASWGSRPGSQGTRAWLEARRAEAPGLPLDVALWGSSDPVARWRFPAERTHQRTERVLDDAPEGAVVDPDHTALLDPSWLDNVGRSQQRDPVLSRWWARLLFLAQAFSTWLGP